MESGVRGGDWTQCTKTCDGRTRTRYRACDNPSPVNDVLLVQDCIMKLVHALPPAHTQVCVRVICVSIYSLS